MILEKLSSNHHEDILTCLKFPAGHHQVHLVSTVDGGTVSTSASLISIVSQHLSAILSDQVSSCGGGDEVTVLIQVKSSAIRKMVELVTSGVIVLNTMNDVYDFGKLTQMMGIRTAEIEISKVRREKSMDMNEEESPVVIEISKVKEEDLIPVDEKRVEINRGKVKEMQKVNGKWICQLCKKEFLKKNRCSLHLMRKHSLMTVPFSFPCELCEVGFQEKCKLIRHQVSRKHRNKLRADPEKQRVDEDRSTVDGHQKLKFPGEMKKVGGRWNCQLCPKDFRLDYKSSCLRHLVKHHQIEIPSPLVCNVCNKGFFSKSQLRNHETSKRHNLKNKNFNHQKWNEFEFVPFESFLQRHSFQRLEDVPRIKKQLTMYKKRKFLDGKWLCTICEASYDLISNINAHLDKVHNVRVRKKTCETCQKTFYHDHTSRLRKHLHTKSHLLKVAENIKDERKETGNKVPKSCDPCKISITESEEVVKPSKSRKKYVMKNRNCEKNEGDYTEEVKNSTLRVNNLINKTDTNSTLDNTINIKISPTTQSEVKNKVLAPLNILAGLQRGITRSSFQSAIPVPVTMSSRASQDYKQIQVDNGVKNSGQLVNRTCEDVDVKDVSQKENTVNIKFLCNDPRLGKSKVITLSDDKPVRKAIKKLSKVVGLKVDDLLFTVNGQALDMTLEAREFEDVTVHVSTKYV